MKKIYRNLLLASSAIASITLPMVSSSCNHKNKTGQNEIIKSVEAYRNVCQLYVNQANKYFTQVIIDTKNDKFLAPIADKFYGELSLSSPNSKLDNLFYNYYNDIKNVNNFASQMQQTFQAILTKITNVDMEKPIDFYRNIFQNHKSIGDMFNNFIQTYAAILGQAEKVNADKAKAYQDKFVNDLDGTKKVFQFSLVPTVLLQLEIKNYGMHDMLSSLSKTLKQPNKELTELIASSETWINKWLQYVNDYQLQNIINDKWELSDIISNIHNEFENNVTKPFYTKFMAQILQQRQPEKTLNDQFNTNPVYIKFNTSDKNVNELTTVDQVLKQDATAKDKKATEAIQNLVTNYSNHGKTLNPSYINDNFVNGENVGIKLAFLSNSQKQETDYLKSTIYNRDATTKKFASQPDITTGLAQKFDASNVNHVIKVTMPSQVAGTLGLIVSPSQESPEMKAFFDTTNGYLPFGIRGLNAVKNYLIGQNLLVFDSLYAGLEGNRSIINQWDQLIFENYNFVLVNKNTTLNVEAYIGINDDLYNKFFYNELFKIPGLIKTRQELENKQIVLEGKYLPWVKNFLIPKYQPSDGMNSTDYYNSKLAQIITVKDGKNYITVDKWMQALNNILDYLDAAPSKDQSQKTIQDAIKELEAQKDSETKDYNDQIEKINVEKNKQETIIASKDSSNEAKENAKKVLAQIKDALSTAKNSYDKNMEALDSQIADAKVTIQEWISKAQDHGLSINQYSDIALVKSQVTSILNTVKAPIDQVQSQIQSENDKLNDIGLLSILFRLQNNN
ncbi:hypothetical protein ACNQ2T_00715 [Mycoplasma sp. Z407A]|uniref:hypothetical protein n=1 Tax=Mycoplasma sp. Z407A TaxID=3401678 RepID=UPI003AAFC76E